MVIEFLIVFFLLILIRGLNEEKFSISKFHWKALPILFLICEILSYFVARKTGQNEWNRQSLFLLHALSYFLLFVFSWECLLFRIYHDFSWFFSEFYSYSFE